MNSYIFCSYHVWIHIFLAEAASAREPQARAASAQREPRGQSPSLPPAPTRPRPIFVDPIITLAARGLEELFSSYAVVSVFGSGEK